MDKYYCNIPVQAEATSLSDMVLVTVGWITILCAVTIAVAAILGHNITNFAETNYIRQMQSVLKLVQDLPPPNPPIQVSFEAEKKYDFIVVGAGTAGSIVASRLSEIGSWKVLLLEAGYPPNNVVDHPTLALPLQFTDYNWEFTGEPQKNFCLSAEKQRCAFPRGRTLGGSSAINYMVYTRGNPDDYNRWAAQGNPGWSYEEILPYYIKAEDARIPVSDPHYHGRGGYQSIEQSYTGNLGNAFIQAGQELGYPLTDYNSPHQIGFSPVQATTRFGRRASTATSYLQPVANRKNLDILTGARVTRVLIDPHTKKAYGVEYNRNDRKFTAIAKKEVILSAGALQSPHLLMLSGVGREQELEKHGIKTVSDLPVGEQLIDHVDFYGLLFSTNFTSPPLPDLFNYHQLKRWYNTGQGPLSSIVGNEAIAFSKIKHPNPVNGASPDFEIIFVTGNVITDNGALARRVLRVSDEYYHKMYEPLIGIPSFIMIPILLHPESVGYIKLKSADPYDDPLFYGNYFSDPENRDMRTLVEAIRFAIKLSETEAFKRYDVRLIKKPVLGCEHLEYNSDEYWSCALQFMAASAFHPTSTCRMGPKDDHTAVVNNRLKVYGTEHLRVIDNSVVPVTIAGHTMAVAILVGEVGSDMIKQDWGVH